MQFETIKQEELEKMYKDGITPIFEFESFDQKTNTYNNLTIIKSVEEILEEQSTTSTTPTLSIEFMLAKELATMKVDNMQKDTIITNTLKAIADLKVEVISLKGGNV